LVWCSVNHVSCDHSRDSQSSTECANSSCFTGLPVRSSLNTHTLSLLVFVCGKCYRLPQFSRNALRLWLYLTSLSHQISWIHELSLRVVISLVKIFCAISAIGFNRFSVSNTYSSRVAEIHIYHILLERSNVGVFQSEQQ